MIRKAKAVLCRSHNQPVVVEQISVDAPKRGEVAVRLGACGVCHSDLSAINGTIALPLPLVLGHEGAGVVEEIGEGVSDLAPGDLIEVLATDPGSVKDFAAWSKMTGNALVESTQEGVVFRFLLKKKG